MTVNFKFTLTPEMFQTPEQVITLGTILIPSPTPADLIVTADSKLGLIIAYSITYPTYAAAAAAIVKALKKETP